MNWLERAAREISETIRQLTAETAKTPVSSVLAFPQVGVSQESGARPLIDRFPKETDRISPLGCPAAAAPPACISGRPPARPQTGTAPGSRSQPGARTRTAVPMAGRHRSRHTAIRYIHPGSALTVSSAEIRTGRLPRNATRSPTARFQPVNRPLASWHLLPLNGIPSPR